MKYLSHTLSKFLCERIDRIGHGSLKDVAEMRVVMESLPAEVVLQVGLALEKYCQAQMLKGRKIRLIYKVAYGLGQEWESSDRSDLKDALEKIREKDWYDSENHLTRWRNTQINRGQDDILVIILIGVDRVADQASLADFYRLDHRTIWKDILKQSFSRWLRRKLEESGVNSEQEYVDYMDEVLKGLFQASLADLHRISSFLENLSLTGCVDGKEALTALTQSLDYFKLPRMGRLAQAPSKRIRKVAQYFAHAVEFFNYGKFLEPRSRKNALEKVDAFHKHAPKEHIDADDLGDYAVPSMPMEQALDRLLMGLRDYMENNNSEEKERLRSVDFIFLMENVLEYKKPKGPPPPKKPKKLKGYPLPVVLRALWISLKDYKDWAREKKLHPARALSKIQIRGDLFKHDFEGGSKEERDEYARAYLCRVLGGMDKYLENHLRLELDPDEEERCVEVESALCPQGKSASMAFDSSRSAEPFLKFTVSLSAGEESFHKEFIWLFPKLHPYRTMDALFGAFKERAAKFRGNPIPVFSVPYFGELMLSKDEEEANRVLQHAIQDLKVENLLEAPAWDSSDPILDDLKNLADQYLLFVEKACAQGLFTALEERYIALESAFREAYGAYLTKEEYQSSQAGPLLFKAFCVLEESPNSSDRYWMWNSHASSLVVTPLHPALLEMLYHQHAYLCEAFETAVKEGLSSSDVRALSERRWSDIEDLAQIQWPLHGTLRGMEGILDTNVRGFGLIHLVGENPEKDATLTTRLLLRYEADEDDELTDEELLGETQESRLIHRIIEDYRRLHPHADDGLAIAAFCGTHIQHLIAGIHSFLEEMFKTRSHEGPYSLMLTIFSESQDDTAVLRWVREWRQRWEMAEQGGKFAYYRQCRISVAHRLVSRRHHHGDFASLLGQIDADISFLINFMDSGSSGNRFIKTERFDHRTRYRMFPVLEKVCCPVMGGMYERRRERIISNRQFKLSTLHTGVMAKLKHITPQPDAEYLVVGVGDFGSWASVVDKLHERTTWVVCIDPLVDEYLLAKKEKAGAPHREIIGFGSGVGAHGEYNYTVSTEKSSLESISRKIKSHVKAKFGVSEDDISERIADSLVREAAHVAGMSLIKATGPSEYVRDFMAYALVRKLLPRDPEAICDEVISLDAFRHWFDSAPTGKRPDLLHVRARIREKYFDIEARLVECKLAQQSERHLEKAREQVEQGLEHLMRCFLPRDRERLEGLEQRPDQRYWWLQLHRLLASKSRVQSPELERTVTALENLSEGLYVIRWGAAVVTFWTDVNGKQLMDEGAWDFEFQGERVPIKRISSGRQFIGIFCNEEKGTKDTLPIETSWVLDGTMQSVQSEEIEKEADTEAPFERPSHERPPFVPIRKSESLPDSHEQQKPSVVTPISKPTIPKRILLGKGTFSPVPVYWEFGHPQLSNRHMLILGTSGMGKTYTIQAILLELARSGQNSLIVDYTDGFHDEHLEEETLTFLKPRQHIVKHTKVPINPFRRQQDLLGGQSILEDPVDTAQRVAGVFSEVYELGDQQRSALYSAVKRGIEVYGEAMNLAHLPQLLKQCAEDGVALGASASSVISKLQPFVDMNPFGGEDAMSWDRFFTDAESRCHILQLAGYLKTAARLITEFSLIDFYWYCRTQGHRKKPKIVVLDEIQNLDQRLESPLGKFLTEGRKFGICLIAATQTLSYFQKDQKDRLFQATHKLFFRPAETEVKSYAQILENATQEKADVWVGRLSSLEKGECYSLGPVFRPDTNKLEVKALKIRIASLEERIAQTTGEDRIHGSTFELS